MEIKTLLDGIHYIETPVCPDEEKGCSARDLVTVESCRAGNLLSNDIKYVIMG